MTMNNEEEIYNRDPHQSSRSFYVLFALQFLPILASIFIEVKLGIATLAIIVPMTFITLIACSNRQTDWSHSRNIILLLFFIWGIYCLLEIFLDVHVLRLIRLQCENILCIEVL